LFFGGRFPYFFIERKYGANIDALSSPQWKTTIVLEVRRTCYKTQSVESIVKAEVKHFKISRTAIWRLRYSDSVLA
jgi:hypothetical protein